MNPKIIPTFLVAATIASAGSQSIFDGPGIPAKSHSSWKEVQKLLNRVARSEANYVKGKEVFFVGRVIGDREGIQYVWWKNRRRIILLLHPIDSDKENLLELKTKYCVDLDTEVVSKEEDINGSSYLVSQSWVNDRVKECHYHGVRLVF